MAWTAVRSAVRSAVELAVGDHRVRAIHLTAYIPASPRASAASIDSSSSRVVIPTEADTATAVPSASGTASPASRARIDSATFRSAAGSMTTNSSPPSRPIRAPCPLAVSRNAWAMACRTASPAACPYVSLIPLNRSRSSTTRTAPAPIAVRACSKKPRRFSTSVSVSWVAWYSSSDWSRVRRSTSARSSLAWRSRPRIASSVATMPGATSNGVARGARSRTPVPCPARPRARSARTNPDRPARTGTSPRESTSGPAG